MNANLADLTRRMVEIAVAGAPVLTREQITDLRRIFKPGDRIPAVTQLPAQPEAKPTRWAA